jgi:hypothetical protein
MRSTENPIRYECVRWFNQSYPTQHGALFGTFNEVVSKQQGSIYKSLGLIAGVADLIYTKNGEMSGIEMKAPQSSHDVIHLIRQSEWLLSVPKIGFFCVGLEGFRYFIERQNSLYPFEKTSQVTHLDIFQPDIILESCIELMNKGRKTFHFPKQGR